MASFEQFCGGPFWNSSQFVSAPWPQFTPCFTLLTPTLTPLAALTLLGPWHVFHLHGQKPRLPLPISKLHSAKMVSQISLTLLTFVLLLMKIGKSQHDESMPMAAFLADILRIIALITIVCLTYFERIKGAVSSIFQLFFWALHSLLYFIPAYSLAMEQVYENDLVTFVLVYINLTVSVILFGLNCLTEYPSGFSARKGYHSFEQPGCPEYNVSALSRLYFMWVFSLIRVGFKRDLQEEDVWSLTDDLTCQEIRYPYEKLYAEEKARCHRERQKSSGFKVKYNTFTINKPTSKTANGKGDVSGGSSAVYSRLVNEDVTDEPGSGPQPSIIRIMWKRFRGQFIQFILYRLAADMCLLIGPVMLRLLVMYLSSEQAIERKWQGYGICLMMFFIGQFRIANLNRSLIIAYRLGLEARNMLVSAIYNKALRIDSEARRLSAVGDIVNLMSVDSQRVMEFIVKISFCITIPIQVGIIVAVIYYYIGPSIFVGVAFLMLIVPLSVLVAYLQKGLVGKNMKYKDIRIRTLNEICNGIKVLKLYAWETSFQEKVHAIRSSEIGILLKIAMLYVFTGVVWGLSGFVMTLLTFATYTLSQPGNSLETGSAFMVLAYFNLVRPILDFMSSQLSLGAQAYVALMRINKFLNQSEIDENNVNTDSSSDYAVSFENAELTWNSQEVSCLKSINLNIPEGSLVAVVGQVGCGKSSLISAVLGDMKRMSGSVSRKGSMAYISQQAWIQNVTLRDNILFGKTYRERKYKAVLSACELERDLTILAAGDQTEIGERGINLSGGQKQRVAVARAVYQDCDLYLLDDPLSAVDSHVGKAMFDHVIGPKGLLKNKTRIFATHSIHVLPQVDFIVVMHEGEIREIGTFEELLAHNGPFAHFLKEHFTKEQMEGTDEDGEVESIKDNIWGRIESLTSDGATSDDGRAARRKKQKETSLSQSKHHDREDKEAKMADIGKLVTDEILAKGRVNPAVYTKYMKAAGTVSLSMAILFFWMFQAFNVATSYWLRGWTADPRLTNSSTPDEEVLDSNRYYLQIYALFGLGQCIFLSCYLYMFWSRTVTAGKNLHAEMTLRLFYAPMSFFDTTPTGRIINRCSRDIEVIDNFLPIVMKEFINNFGQIAITILIILIQTPAFAILMVPVLILFIFALRFYIPTSRQLRRIENVNRSPIYSHFSASLSGASTIRAFNAQERFIQENQRRVNFNSSFFFAASVALRWLAVNLDTLSNIVIMATALFQVIASDPDPGSAGLILSYALQITGSLPWMVRQIADFETHIVSVERVKEYSEIEQEAAPEIQGKRPPRTWPSAGHIEFNKCQVRYREGLDLVINGLTLSISGGQKIGVVGRTGAGKSSLSLSLFRLMEAAGGAIFIDGTNIADMGLRDLRSRLTILPQDPVIYSGTVRFNLDPFNSFSDDEIWTALERAHLKLFVSQLPEKLQYECGEEGLNLSVGARQLLCLARTLLRKTKILILDEATAAVDIQTDTLIQNTIRFAFQECTVIAIAHRLNTIMDYDKVLVLDNGDVKEFDSPSKLLNNPKSLFYAMAVDAKLI